jgi:hypothetical protein
MNRGSEHFLASPIPRLIRLQICLFYSSDISKMILLLQNILNLRHLNISLWYQLIDGHQWEQIIDNYLPNLKTFALKMRHELFVNENIEEQANRFISKFIL